MSDSVPLSQVLLLTEKSRTIISAILDSLEVSAHIDGELLEEVSHFFLRDIYRIDRQQKSSISASKFAGYWAFWIRKLKPLAKPTANSEHGKKYSEARSINEVIALQFGIEMLIKCRRAEGFYDNVKRECTFADEGACTGERCLANFAYEYVNFDDEFYHNYLIFSMRNRTFGPHHFALLLENLTFAACDGVRGKEK